MGLSVTIQGLQGGRQASMAETLQLDVEIAILGGDSKPGQKPVVPQALTLPDNQTAHL